MKLFSWIAGVALLLAAVFFLRYSIDRGWLMPPVRMVIGILVGIGLLTLCELKAARSYPVTANAMDASAIAILFSTFFAAHALWNLISTVASFVLLALVTVIAVLLSIRRDSMFIALLGLLGGFSTPALLSTGENRPISLFGYRLLLNAGLAWIASRKKWPLLTTLSLAFTVLYQWAWVMKFLTAGQLPLAAGIFLIFPILIFAGRALGREEGNQGGWMSLYGQTANVSATVPLLFAFYSFSVGPVASVALWGLALLLLVLSAGLFFEGSVSGVPLVSLAGVVLSWIVLAVWWGSVNLTAIFLPALIVVAGFAMLALAGNIWLQKQATGDQPSVLANGIFLGLVGHLFLFIVAGQKSVAIPPWPLLGVLLVLDLAVGVAALYARRGELHLAAIIASAFILMTWTQTATEEPWPAVAILAAGALVLFAFLWIFLARRIRIKGAFFQGTAAGTVIPAQVIAIVAAVQSGSPAVP